MTEEEKIALEKEIEQLKRSLNAYKGNNTKYRIAFREAAEHVKKANAARADAKEAVAQSNKSIERYIAERDDLQKLLHQKIDEIQRLNGVIETHREKENKLQEKIDRFNALPWYKRIFI